MTTPPPPSGNREGKAQPLFREEAVAEQQDRWLGTVLVVPPLSQSLQTLVVALVVAGILGLLVFGEYTRKVRLAGALTPETGLIEIVAPLGGSLVALDVDEGQEVAAGAPIARLSGERRSEAVGATMEQVLRSLQDRRASLVAERTRSDALFEQRAALLSARIAALRQELQDLEAEARLVEARIDLTAAMAERQRDLRARDLTTELAVFTTEKDLLDESLALQQLARQRSALSRTLTETEAEQSSAPVEHEQRKAEITRAIAALDQEIAEAEAQREFVVTAPKAGTITALQAARGDTLAPSAPLMTLVPAGARLEARLYGPSRAIGFVRPGQKVRIRYEAYPHQKFGLYEGTVASVSRAPVAAGLVPQGTAPAEPVYRILVDLASQHAQAYGEAVPLQPGMKLQADILIETRNLYEWILDPLRALAGGGTA
ncbi:MAG: HlyD family efflux transporter periplasmic adaptor subunit [Roseovarius sp.]